MSEAELEVASEAEQVADTPRLDGILRGTATYTALGMTQRLIGFVLLPLYARVLTPSDYGTIAILLTIAGAMQLLLSFGLETSVFRGFFLYKDERERHLYLNTVGWFSIIMPLIIVGPLFLIAFVTDGFGLTEPSYIGIELLAAALTVGASTMPLAYLRAKEEFGGYVWVTAASTLVIILTKALLVLGFRWGIAGWVLSDLCGGVTIFVAAVAFCGHRWDRRVSRSLLKAALVLGLPLVPHLTSHWFLALSDRLILGTIVSTREVGLYSMGYQFGLVLGVVLTETNRGILPMYGRAIHSVSERDRLGPVASGQIALTALLGGLVAVLGPIFVTVALPDSYQGAGAVIPAIVLSYVFFGWYYVPMNVVSVMAGKTAFVFIPTVIAASLNIILNLILVPRFGIQAAAVNTAVGYGVLCLMITVYCRRQTRYRLQLDWRGIATVIGLVGAAIVVCRLVVCYSGAVALLLDPLMFIPAAVYLLVRSRRLLSHDVGAVPT